MTTDREEATGTFKAVMSSEGQNVGGFEGVGALHVGGRGGGRGFSAAADKTTFPGRIRSFICPPLNRFSPVYI